MDWHDVTVFLHVITAVFTSVPLYSLVVVNERARLGTGAHADVDRYMENVIRGQSTRCYVFQFTLLLSGLLLLALGPLGLGALVGDLVVGLKLLLLLALMALLSLVHFSIQPAIDRLLLPLTGDRVPEETWTQMAALRLRRKRLAAICLFLVIGEVILGVQVYGRFPLWLTAILFLLAALYARHVFRSRILYGWV